MTRKRFDLALLVLAAAAATAGCVHRPATHLRGRYAGMFVSAAEPVNEKAYATGALRNANGEPLLPGEGRSIVETVPPPAKKHPPFDARVARAGRAERSPCAT